MSATRVLLVEDDTRLAEMLVEYLGEHGFCVRHTERVEEARALLEESTPDAVLLDVMLPDGDGFELCRRIRAVSDLPVVMITARGDETDRIVGLELGADDYLPKPFNPRELLARLRAVLRRAVGARGQQGEVLRFGALQIDRGERVARLAGARCDLTSHQFEVLRVLAENAGRALSREQLSEAVRGEAYGPFDRSIDVHVSRIRAAIEDDPKRPKRIQTVRGVGYLFARLAGDEGAA
jgi:DNA-binding response OmpR family regulator